MAALVATETAATQLLLIDKIYQVLKEDGAKKNAVEATLKQIFEKPKGSKRWVIREDFKYLIEIGRSNEAL